MPAARGMEGCAAATAEPFGANTTRPPADPTGGRLVSVR